MRKKQAADTGKRELQKLQEEDTAVFHNKHKKRLSTTVSECLPQP